MMNLQELYLKISANFWKSAQVASWAKAHFYERIKHRQTRTGTSDANLPIITNSSGYVDPSFYDLSDPTITVQDDNFTIVDDGDNTKAVQFQLSGITTATTRTITVPDANFTLMGVAVAQSPQNKTYDSTNISGLTAKNPPVNADSVVIVDSAASNVFKRVTWSNILSAITTYYNSVVATLTNKSIDASANTLTNIGTSALSNDAVSNAKLANMAESTVKGRALGAGTGDPTDLSVAQLNAIIDSAAIFLLLAGRSGGQTVYGGTGAGNALALYSTSNATKGVINMADVLYVDEVNDWVGVKQASPQVTLHVGEGTDVPNATLADIQGYFTRNGNTSIVIRNATNNVELIVAAGSTAGVFGAVTNHDLRLRANNVDHVYISASGQVIVGALYSTAASGVLAVKAGTSTNDAAVGGVLYVTTTNVGNVGGGTDDLITYSVPANTLSANGMGIEFKGWGTFASTGNAKTLTFVWGSQTYTMLFDGVGGTACVWHVEGTIIRTGATSQKIIVRCTTNHPTATVGFSNTSGTQTLSSATTIKFTGAATANNDIVQEAFVVKWNDANT